MIDQFFKIKQSSRKGEPMIDQYDSESDFEIRREGSEITIIGYTGSKTEVCIPHNSAGKR